MNQSADLIHQGVQQAGRLRRNSLSSPGKAKAFLCRRLDRYTVNPDPERICHILPHLRKMRHHLRSLGDDDRIDISDLIIVLFQQLPNLLKESNTGYSLISRIRIRKMLADIPERSRSEQRIHDRVNNHIRI